MRTTALVLAAIAVVAVSAVIAAEVALPQAAAPKAPALQAKASPDSIFEVAYLITWEKDPRFKARDPFQTVLHTVGGPAGKQASKLALPRTPSEEEAFIQKAASSVKEAEECLAGSDFKAVKERVELVRQMVAIPMTSQSAKEKMAEVSKELAAIETKYASMQARAALAEALQLAARMQAYFEDERYGDVLGSSARIQELDNESGLKSSEVALTAVEVLARCADLKRRAEIHLDFAKMDVKVDAVSFFPEGRSFAIVNAEVFGEGALIAPDLTLASVAGGKVTFDFKGEKIPQGLAVAKEHDRPQGTNAARRVR
jgi:hypothetical protein